MSAVDDISTWRPDADGPGIIALHDAGHDLAGMRVVSHSIPRRYAVIAQAIDVVGGRDYDRHGVELVLHVERLDGDGHIAKTEVIWRP